MERIKILIAEDVLDWREQFIDRWNLFYSDKYEAEFYEAETALDAITKLNESYRTNNFFDIVVCDIDFSENQLHEDKNAGFQIIKKAKGINPHTQIIWYSAQKDEDFTRFKTEETLKEKGYIDFKIKKAYISELFEDTINDCIQEILKARSNLIAFLSKLFDSYNYGEDEDIGFYKLTHTNYDHDSMLKIIDKTINFFNSSKEKELLDDSTVEKIENYLYKIKIKYPSPDEMEDFKSFFRLIFSDDILKSCQKSLIQKNIKINNFCDQDLTRIYCEKDKILLGLKTIYDNIAKHNFIEYNENYFVNTYVKSENSNIILTIESNGNSFNPKEAFSKNSPGLISIKKLFNKYCKIIYESDGILYNIFDLSSTNSTFKEGVRITLIFYLPSPKIKNFMRI